MNSDFDDQLLDAVRNWSADKNLDDARQQRSKARWQEQLAGEEMRFEGAVLDVFDRELAVELLVEGGHRHAGIIRAVGTDFCAIAAHGRPTTFVALNALRGVQVAMSPRSVGAASARRWSEDEPSLVDILGELASDRAVLRFRLYGIEQVMAGELFAVGTDVVSVGVNSPATATLFIPIDQICEVSLAL